MTCPKAIHHLPVVLNRVGGGVPQRCCLILSQILRILVLCVHTVVCPHSGYVCCFLRSGIVCPQSGFVCCWIWGGGAVTLQKLSICCCLISCKIIYVLVSNLHFLIFSHIPKLPKREILGSHIVLKYRFHKIPEIPSTTAAHPRRHTHTCTSGKFRKIPQAHTLGDTHTWTSG